MAPSVMKHRFQNSLDMVAARSMRNLERNAQSGTGNAWCIVDSPTLGRMSGVSRRLEAVQKSEKPATPSGSCLAVQAINVAPLNIKKIRRRGLVSGVHLTLPPSPLPTGSPKHSPPETALTFTAEWDLTENTFVFTPFESSYPPSSVSSQFSRSPVPVNVDEDTVSRSASLISPSVYSSMLSPHPAFTPSRPSYVGDDRMAPNRPESIKGNDSAASSHGTPVSSIFDRNSMYSHSRQLSQSTVASSVLEDPSKCGQATSSVPITRETALHTFKQELHRAVPEPDDKSDFDRGVVDEMDQDLLMAPMHAFEKTLWESTESDAQAIRRSVVDQVATVFPNATRRERPLPDVPRSASTDSVYSSTSVNTLDTASIAGGTLRRHLQLQIRKALSGTLLFKR